MLARVMLVVMALLLGSCSAGSVTPPQEDGFSSGDGDGAADDGGGEEAPDGGDPAGDGAADTGSDPGADPADAGGDNADAGPDDCGRVVTFEQGLVPQRYLHVAPAGSDGSGDGSAQNPYATIEHAARQATPGTAVVIHAGSYAGGIYLEGIRGRADAPIWIGGAAGEARPVIEGGNQALHLVRPRYLVVHDLEARGGAQNGINCDDGGDYGDAEAARFVVFRGLDIHDVGGDGNQDCLKLSGLDDYWVLDSRFARCGGDMSGSGIDHVGCHRGLIRGCRFEQNSGNAIQCKGGSSDIDIEANLLVEPGERGVNMGGSTGYQYFRPPLDPGAENAEARRIRVQANVIIGGTTALAFVGCVDCLAAHNTIVSPQRWLLRILQETVSDSTYTFAPCRDNQVVNNIFWFERGQISTYLNIGPDTEPASFTFSHNLWYAADDAGASTPDLPAAETAGIYGRDPAFVDPAGGDYHPDPTSPAAGSGTDWPGATGSDGDGRCFASPPSRGAYEVP